MKESADGTMGNVLREDVVSEAPAAARAPFDKEIVLSAHTVLDMDKQLEVGKATEPKLLKFAALACAVVIVAYNVANCLFLHDNALFLALMSAGPVLVLGVLAFRGTYARVLLTGQRRYKKSGAWPEYQIEFTKGWFSNRSATSGKTYRHAYEEITQIKDTDNLLLLICESSVVVLEKQGINAAARTLINERILAKS